MSLFPQIFEVFAFCGCSCELEKFFNIFCGSDGDEMEEGMPCCGWRMCVINLWGAGELASDGTTWEGWFSAGSAALAVVGCFC